MGYTGEISVHKDDLLAGWCFDTLNPSEHDSVAVYFEEIFIKSVKTNLKNHYVEGEYGKNFGGYWLPLDCKFTELLPVGTRLRVETSNGQVLDNYRSEGFSAIGKSRDDGRRLRGLIKKGYRLDKWGALKIPFSAQSKQQKANFADSMSASAEYFRDRFNLTLFPHYGSLLGYARGKSFLQHDDDVDMSYVIFRDDLKSVSDHFYKLVALILLDGHDCHVVNTGQMHFRLKGQKETVDIFTSWQNKDRCLNTFFGVSGFLSQRISFFTDELQDKKMKIPKQYKEILALIYGKRWNIPDPSFQFNLAENVELVMLNLHKAGLDKFNRLNMRQE